VEKERKNITRRLKGDEEKEEGDKEESNKMCLLRRRG
jgi:hypothetical protein